MYGYVRWVNNGHIGCDRPIDLVQSLSSTRRIKKRLTEREGLLIASAEARTAAIAIRENFILNWFLRELIRSFESVFGLNKLKNYVVLKERKYGWQLMNFTSDSYRWPFTPSVLPRLFELAILSFLLQLDSFLDSFKLSHLQQKIFSSSSREKTCVPSDDTVLTLPTTSQRFNWVVLASCLEFEFLS